MTEAKREVCGNCGLDNIEHGIEVCLRQLDNTVQHLRQKLAASELENKAWRAVAAAAMASDVTVMVKPWNRGCVVGSQGLVGEGDTPQAAAIDLATKLGLLEEGG